GFRAFTAEDFVRSQYARPHAFDSLLCAHVVEHMTASEAVDLLRSYLGYVRPGGRGVVITPQERGVASDPTHVERFDFDGLARLCRRLGLEPEASRSFPLPRVAGHLFYFNEFVTVARLPEGSVGS